MIIVLCFVFRNMPVGVRAGMAAMSQIDRSLDEASLTLRGRAPQTLRDVVLPLLRPADRRRAGLWLRARDDDGQRRHLPGHAPSTSWRPPTSSSASINGDYGLAIAYCCGPDRAHAGGHPADPVRRRRAPARPRAPRPVPRAGRPRVSVEFQRRVVKRYGADVAAVVGRQLHRRGRHAGDAARPLGLRQDHDLAHDRRARAADRGPHPDRRPRRHQLSAPPQRDVSMVFQSYALFPHMSVLENVCYGLRRSGLRKR